MNLTNEPWIPVRRADGSPDKIAPYQITDHIGTDKSPIIAVASPRPDFDGALVQFLIGLLQTTCTPETDADWWDWREQPPTSEELSLRFEPVSLAFQLKGAQPFMQEKLIGSSQAKWHPFSYLLIGAATDSTLKNNTDHFQKRVPENSVYCIKCAAAALYTLQTFAPGGGGGGDGKFTSLRGGGPLTTLVLGENLWETIWLNVVLGELFSFQKSDKSIFPWLDISYFVNAKHPVRVVHSDDMAPEHLFWGMPRRIELELIDNGQKASCSICGEIEETICNGYFDRSGGMTYQYEVSEVKGGKNKKVKKPSWIYPNHPLSPYIESTDSNDNRPSAVHPQSDGIGYRHWLGIIENSTEANIFRKPARVIEQYRNLIKEDGRLWAFGYDMDNMKARCWHDATMPILVVPKGQEGIFKPLVEKIVQAAHWTCGIIRGRIKDALVGDSDIRGDLSYIQLHFWNYTEAAFYCHARQLRDGLGEQEKENLILESWRTSLRDSALTIFDHYAQVGDFDYVHPRTIAVARNDLSKTMNGKKLRDLLRLPQPDRKATKSQRKTQ